jgi:AbrB family looped-hinge helix DNA binding protein
LRDVPLLGTMEPMGKLSLVSSFQIGHKGRSVIPAAVRKAAGISEGDELVAVALGEGRVLVETVAAVRKRVWDAAPKELTGDPTKDVRDMRLEDTEVSDAAFERRRPTGTDAETEAESEARGQALLAEFGL